MSVRLTLAGNASVLLEGTGIRLAMDPWLSPAIGPWKRLKEPGFCHRSLAGLDAILISHAHPDHLCRETLAQVPKKTPVVSPPGTPLYRLTQMGFEIVRSVDAWDSWSPGSDVEVIATPCFHTRYSVGFLIRLHGQTIYFAGDASPRTPFREIARRCGPIDVALLPVGGSSLAAGPLQRHLTPLRAAHAACELEARSVIPMHWGHMACFPAMLDRFRGTAEQFQLALHAVGARTVCHDLEDGETLLLDTAG